ncbi:hypothetical protein O181_071524 [Austropuccinia psidii MF-1]|uniref:Uncharacterized protein n=1 Tax=Austropuccinia psidii MF-1 TaxID=1389203 RepID=A0A9Q3F2X9_9BASI|nr:hypothetical protein [Austropuccinia psidii MF-1]
MPPGVTQSTFLSSNRGGKVLHFTGNSEISRSSSSAFNLVREIQPSNKAKNLGLSGETSQVFQEDSNLQERLVCKTVSGLRSWNFHKSRSQLGNQNYSNKKSLTPSWPRISDLVQGNQSPDSEAKSGAFGLAEDILGVFETGISPRYDLVFEKGSHHTDRKMTLDSKKSLEKPENASETSLKVQSNDVTGTSKENQDGSSFAPNPHPNEHKRIKLTPRKRTFSSVYFEEKFENPRELQSININSQMGKYSHSLFEKLSNLFVILTSAKRVVKGGERWVRKFMETLTQLDSWKKFAPRAKEKPIFFSSSDPSICFKRLAGCLWYLQTKILIRFGVPENHEVFKKELLAFRQWCITSIDITPHSTYLRSSKRSRLNWFNLMDLHVGFMEANQKRPRWVGTTKENKRKLPWPQISEYRLFEAKAAINILRAYYESKNPTKWKLVFENRPETFFWMLEQIGVRIFNHNLGSTGSHQFDFTSLNIFPWPDELTDLQDKFQENVLSVIKLPQAQVAQRLFSEIMRRVDKKETE